MLLFAHIGITLGVGLAASEAWRHLRGGPAPDQTRLHPAGPPSGFRPGLLTLVACIVGSLLPDIIDKPLGLLIFPGFFGNDGRILAHTLLFLLIVLAVGLYFYPRRFGALLLVLAYGDAMHLVLDSMWRTPQTLFWPLLGWSFPRSAEYSFLGTMWNELFHDPSAYVPELIGLGILFICGVWLLMPRPTRSS